MFPNGETAIRQRGVVGSNGYGDVTVDWSDPAELTITGVAFDPAASVEVADGTRAAVVTRPVVYCSGFWADVLAADRLVVRGVTYEVDGTPRNLRHPDTGWLTQEIRLRGASG